MSTPTDDEKRYTERDKVRFQREGYARRITDTQAPIDPGAATYLANDAYPMPVRTRPRVVVHDRTEYRITESRCEWRQAGGNATWPPWAGIAMTFEELRLYADLMANPTEPDPDSED